MNTSDHAPHEQSALDISKPCVIFFGGGAHLTKGAQSVASQKQSMKEMLASSIQQDQYNFYTLTDNHASGDKQEGIYAAGQKNLAYNDAPREYFSKEAESFAASYLMPLVKEVKDKQGAERLEAIKSTANRFSAVTFLGYSYGTAFVQEISNALKEQLAKKGYTAKEQHSVMQSLASINIGATFKYTNKYPDISQATLVLSSDKDAVKNSGISISNPDLDFNIVTQRVAYAVNENHTLVVVGSASSNLRQLTYKDNIEPKSLHTLIRDACNWTDCATNTEMPSEIIRQPVHKHNKKLHTDSLRWNSDGETLSYTFPANIIGINCVRYLQQLVTSSLDAINTNVARDSAAIIHQVTKKHLCKESVTRDQIQTQFFKQLFDQLANPPSPSR